MVAMSSIRLLGFLSRRRAVAFAFCCGLAVWALLWLTGAHLSEPPPWNRDAPPASEHRDAVLSARALPPNQDLVARDHGQLHTRKVSNGPDTSSPSPFFMSLEAFRVMDACMQQAGLGATAVALDPRILSAASQQSKGGHGSESIQAARHGSEGIQAARPGLSSRCTRFAVPDSRMWAVLGCLADCGVRLENLVGLPRPLSWDTAGNLQGTLLGSKHLQAVDTLPHVAQVTAVDALGSSGCVSFHSQSHGPRFDWHAVMPTGEEERAVPGASVSLRPMTSELFMYVDGNPCPLVFPCTSGALPPISPCLRLFYTAEAVPRLSWWRDSILYTLTRSPPAPQGRDKASRPSLRRAKTAVPGSLHSCSF